MTFREGKGKRKREGGWTLEHFGQRRRRRRDRVPSFFSWYARGWVLRGERKKGGLKTLVIITLTTAAAGRREKWESGILWDGGKRRA